MVEIGKRFIITFNFEQERSIMEHDGHFVTYAR